MQSIRPPGFGIIVRTVAENKGAADLHSDLEGFGGSLGRSCTKRLRNAKPGKRVLGELNKTNAVSEGCVDPRLHGHSGQR